MIKNWERVEKIVANLIGGKRTPGSGNGHVKGDIVSGQYMIECKTTIKDAIQVQCDWFQELETYIGKKEVLLVVGFKDRIVAFEPLEKNPNCRAWRTWTLDEDRLEVHAEHGNVFQGYEWYWTLHPNGIEFLKEIADEIQR